MNLIPGTGAGDVKLTSDAANRQDTGPLAFDGAEWIWDRDAGEQAGTRYFQKEFHFPAGEKPEKAEVIITADNQWTLSINGRKVGQHDTGANSWRRPKIIDISNDLVIEQNAMAVECVNTVPGPAGLLVRLRVHFASGKICEMVSDASWLSSAKTAEGWNKTGFTAGDDWRPCAVIGR